MRRFRDGDPEPTPEVRERIVRIVAFKGYGISLQEREEIAQKALLQVWQSESESRAPKT